VQFLPVAIVSPVAGVVVDRFDRRRLMISADLLRGVLILGLLLVRRPDQVWIAYVVMALTVSATSFFEPARTATIPNVTSDRELMPANALSSATWSAMLALGASIGGVVTALAGRNVAFVINALSFFVSAVFIARTRYDSTPPRRDPARGFAALTGLSTSLVTGVESDVTSATTLNDLPANRTKYVAGDQIQIGGTLIVLESAEAAAVTGF